MGVALKPNDGGGVDWLLLIVPKEKAGAGAAVALFEN